MAEVYIAIKPKYPTRKAVDKVLFNEGNFLTIINEKATRQLAALLDTSYVSLIKDGKYYPVNNDNYEAQYALVAAGSAPTVAEDTAFGVKTLDYFASAANATTFSNVQANVELYNGIIKGKLYKIVNYSNIGDANINKNGFWFVFSYDLTNATAEGYSNIKMADGQALVNGNNYVFMGTAAEDVSKYIFTIKATLTVGTASGDASVAFVKKLSTDVMLASDDIVGIEVDGREFTSLVNAFSAIKSNGGTIIINKSISENNAEPIDLDTGKEWTLKINNNATVSVNKYIRVLNGTLNITGEGTLKEITYGYSPVMLQNLDTSKTVNVNIAKGITLMGWTGLFFNKASYNLNATCYGNLIGNSDGSAEGAGVYVNGNVLSGSFNFFGSTEGTYGLGAFISGNVDVVLSNAVLEGTNSGFEIRSGSVVASNSRFVSKSTEEPTMVPAGNGSTSTACAFAVAQHTTKKKINVVIDNCDLIGNAAFMEGNPEGNPTATADTTIHINSGNYAGKIKTLTPASDCTKFLYGGLYSEEPTATYVADGYVAKKTYNNRYEVVKQ